ncbi:FadD3 family acyl-CoA ligase [Dermatobacter hominis]|uniref:FadD3 family acyl-CoA ligase n=1 Tax=Dermatobacter hominis TaxID=2884263 RepID=UPI001D0FD155|nr:FadD3 family acyl-CoA ligase [Dermatobacter hominis]UDY36666.1 FadD3 family acyl-CoA ligase [Dermatobacter hominis]
MGTTDATTIPAALAAAVRDHGGRTAVVDGDTVLTWSELADAARTFGAALCHVGVRPGDRVAIWAPNSARWIVALLGLASAGATLVPVNTRFKGDEAAVVLSRSGAGTLVTVTDFLGADHVAMLRGATTDVPALRTIVVAAGPPVEGTTSWDELLAGVTEADLAELDRRAAAVAATDVSDILFTSGTTGVPKGVVQTHAGTMGVARDWVAMTGIRAEDRYLMVNPYFHMFGLKAGILASTVAGLTMHPVAVFDADEVLGTVERERITVLPGAPTLYQSILDGAAAGDRDLSSLRIAVTGAADIPVTLIRRVQEELPFEVVLSGYGLSEGGTATATEPGDPPEAVATTVGRPRPGFELRVVDGDGAEVPQGDAGEVLLRGATVMSHYLDDPDSTAAALSADGWLRTGDIGVVDGDGRLRIVGRAKDMFIVGGFNAYPAEIEDALLGHPAIARAAVIGIPDERLGEVGMAFVVPAAGAHPDPAEVIAWARERMANYKVPRRVEVVDDLPVNAAGKVEKLVLRERAGVA